MKFYLSSYKIGNEPDKLKAMTLNGNRRVAYISNAMDVSSRVESRTEREEVDMSDLRGLGFKVERLDLRDFFDKKEALKDRLMEFDVIWVCGGNTFVLRQAMYLSGFDDAIHEMRDSDVLYGGYSAGVCVLAASMKGLDLMDDPNKLPYKESTEVIWEGLNIIQYLIVPHFQSDHPESDDANKVVQFCVEDDLAHKTLKDGEVIIIE